MTVKPAVSGTTTVVIGSGMTIRPTAHFAGSAPDREQRRRSIVILSLLAACAFLFVLSLCLLTALVLVGRNLSADAGSHSQLTVASDDKQHLFINNNHIDHDGDDGDDAGEEERERTNEPQYNRSTIFLPNSVFNTSAAAPPPVAVSPGTGPTGRMNRVFKMGTQVAERLGFRLPRHIRPVHYELWLQPDLQRETFSGRVGIELNVSESTNYIVLHSKKLSITETVLRTLGTGPEEVTIARAYELPEHEYWVIETQGET